LIGGLDAQIQQHTRIVNKSDREMKDIMLAKLFENKLKKKQASEELTEYINLSKYWQTKKFAENAM
jgi:hypothetical protein